MITLEENLSTHLLCRSDATYRTFSYRGAHIWNDISQNVPPDVSYGCFKNLHILTQPIPHFRLNI